jgi:hypothetical protein
VVCVGIGGRRGRLIFLFWPQGFWQNGAVGGDGHGSRVRANRPVVYVLQSHRTVLVCRGYRRRRLRADSEPVGGRREGRKVG